jgi:hypothetical protein
MTFEKFKEEFEACEKGQTHSGEFQIALKEIHGQFNFLALECAESLLVSFRMSKPKFGYFESDNTLLIDKEIYQRFLEKSSDKDKIEIIKYCFSKYFRMNRFRIKKVKLCSKDEIISRAKKYENDYTECKAYVNEDTGEVIVPYRFRLDIELLKHKEALDDIVAEYERINNS